MASWFEEIFNSNVRLAFRSGKTLFSKRSAFQQIDIFETEAWGRTLAIDSIFMTSEKDEHFYHEMLVHPPLATAQETKKVLVIGGGDGGTVREVLRHPGVESVLMVEIDGEVIEASKKFLPGIGTAWNDPRLEVRVGDGIAFAKEAAAESFDIVLLDGSDPVGPAEGLFNKSFYEDCKRILRPGGVFCLQSESPITFEKIFFDIQKTLRGVFPHVHPYFGPVPIYGSGAWSWTWASTSLPSPLSPHVDRIEKIEKDCKVYNRSIHQAAFALPNYVAEKLGKC